MATDRLLEEWGPANGYLAVPAQPHKELLEKGFAMCTLYCQVSQKMRELGIRVFNVTSKLHQTEHVFLLAKSIHPHLCWNFRGEEYMGTMSISGCLEYKHVAILKRFSCSMKNFTGEGLFTCSSHWKFKSFSCMALSRFTFLFSIGRCHVSCHTEASC